MSNHLREHNDYDGLVTKALMEEHPEWDMETVREAALISSNVIIQASVGRKSVSWHRESSFLAGKIEEARLIKQSFGSKRYNSPLYRSLTRRIERYRKKLEAL